VKCEATGGTDFQIELATTRARPERRLVQPGRLVSSGFFASRPSAVLASGRAHSSHRAARDAPGEMSDERVEIVTFSLPEAVRHPAPLSDAPMSAALSLARASRSIVSTSPPPHSSPTSP
jgi:hypothetical protein